MTYEPCGRCGKDHDTRRCPDSPGFWYRRGIQMKWWQRRGARAGGLGKASLLRLKRVFAEMREGK